MHKNFGEWFAVLEVDADLDNQQLRWDGVTALVKAADKDIVEGLIRLVAVSRQAPSLTSLAAIKKAFKDSDEAFPSRGNDRELQVLAGITLVVLIQSTSNFASLAALALTTTFSGGNRRADVPMDLLTMAEEAIVRLADANRARPSLDRYVSDETIKLDFAIVAQKYAEVPDVNGFASAMTQAANSILAAMRTVARRQQSAVREINKFLLVQDEELQLLWWLTGQRSWDLDCLFSEVPQHARPLIFAKELANHTEILPGPRSITALLSKSGLNDSDSVELTQLVNAVDDAWVEELMSVVDPSPVSCPIHFALKRRFETGAGPDWIPAWAATSQLPTTLSASSLELATRFYRERLFILFG